MFGLNGEIWYYESSPAKTADRPHGITIALGVMSPALAIVAIAVSFFSLRTSQQSLKIGQRAYLSYEIETFDFEPALNPAASTPLSLITVVKITNVGNTPAYFDSGAQTHDVIDFKSKRQIARISRLTLTRG